MWKCKCGWKGELLEEIKILFVDCFEIYYGCPECGASSQEMEVGL